MNGEIVTKELQNGLYQHTYTIETYYLTETIISPVALPPSETNTPYHLTGEILGQYEPYCLSHFVQSRDAVVERGQLIELATVQNQKLVINPEAIKVFRHYPENQISFVGNYGRENSGKSFWYDKILNLTHCDGNNYASNPKKQGIYFWSIPFTKGKLKFFLLDFVGFQGKDKLSKQDEKLLDLELLLAEKFVIVPEPEDENLVVLPIAYQQLLGSQKRFTDKGVVANKFSPYWPNEIYTLYRSAKPVRKEIDNIGTLFQVYNFSILHDAMNTGATGTKKDLSKSTIFAQSEAAPLNQKYVRMTSIVFQDIYEKMKGKHYGGVTFNGQNLPRILEQAKIAINNGQGVKIDQIFKGVRKDIHEDTYIRSKMLFLKEVDPLRKDPEPKPVDVLTDTFERGNTAAYAHLDNAELSRGQRQAIERKLRLELDEIQQEILEENKKKTYAHYTKILPVHGKSDTEQAYLDALKTTFTKDKEKTRLDHQDTPPVARQLQSVALVSGLVGPDDSDQSQQILKLKKKVVESRRSLVQIKQNKTKQSGGVIVAEPNYHYTQKERSLVNRSTYLQREIQEKKSIINQTPEQKEATLKKLRQTHMKNQETKSKLKEQKPESEEIKILEELVKRMINKNRQRQDGIASLEKSFISNRSVRSVIRQIKNEDEPIKKVTKK